MSPPTLADGSAQTDARRVRIDRTPPEKYRWRCPNGHVDWDRTNNHIWCPGCARASRHDPDVDPEHYHIVDNQTDEEIPWSAIEVVSCE